MSMSDSEIAIAKGMLARGDKQQHIAAFFDVNSGRIAEINTGVRGGDIPPATENLPPPGPPTLNHRAPVDIILSALEAAAFELTAYANDIAKREGPVEAKRIRSVVRDVHSALGARQHELYGGHST